MEERLPLFRHEPRTEQEVVCLFGALLNELGMVIERVQTPFPDCTVWLKDTNQKLLIEFELYASHFREHGHPMDGCDKLVCWLDDVGNWPEGFVLELSEVVAASRPDLIADIAERDPKRPWDQAAFMKRAAADATSTQDIALIERIIAFAKEHRLGPQWLVNASGVFAVGQDTQYFKIYSTGQIVFPFSRLKPQSLFPELRTRLNAAIPGLKLQEADQRSKGKGGQLSKLFDSDARLDEFLSIWTWFRDAT